MLGGGRGEWISCLQGWVVQGVWGLIFQFLILREQQRELINWIRQRGYKGDVSKALQFLIILHRVSSHLPQSAQPFPPIFPVLKFPEKANCRALGYMFRWEGGDAWVLVDLGD